MGTSDSNCYIITYRDPRDDKIISLVARRIEDSNLGLSFIAVSDFIFKENSLIINPQEEALKDRFAKTKKLHLSIYTILSIEEVGEAVKGIKFKKDKSNLLILPKNKSE